MGDNDSLRFCLDFDRGTVPVGGVVTPERGMPHRFDGWIELFSVLTALVPRDGGDNATGGEG